jgi:branched-chain amino acid aminotransferase
MGMKVERRPVPIEELPSFDEVGACGTAAVITPIRKIVDPDMNITYEYCKDGNPGPLSTKLYNSITAIQNGEEEDPFHWVDIVD